jgi:hypothetical protein
VSVADVAQPTADVVAVPFAGVCKEEEEEDH